MLIMCSLEQGGTAEPGRGNAQGSFATHSSRGDAVRKDGTRNSSTLLEFFFFNHCVFSAFFSVKLN
jgi:hypothetical protein